MSTTKRIFAMLLTVVMLASMIPVFTVSAAPTEMTISKIYTPGWENWLNSPTYQAGSVAVTQLGVYVNDEAASAGIEAYYDEQTGWSCDFKLVITNQSNAADKATITLDPATFIHVDGTKLYLRFETCEGKAPNRFIPTKGATYSVDLTVSVNGDAKYHGFSEGYECPMEPCVYDNQYLTAWNDGFENWEGGTYNPTTELLPTIKDKTGTFIPELFEKYYNAETKTWSAQFTLTVTNVDDANDSKTFTAAPNSYYRAPVKDDAGEVIGYATDSVLLRFEICEDPINFIPQIGATYKVTMTIKDGNTEIFKGSFSKFICSVIPYVKGEPTQESMYPCEATGGLYFTPPKNSFEKWGDWDKMLIALVTDLSYNDEAKVTKWADYYYNFVITGIDGSVTEITEMYGDSGQTWGTHGILVRLPVQKYGFEPVDGVVYTFVGELCDKKTNEVMYTFTINEVGTYVPAKPQGVEFTQLNSDPIFDVATSTLTLDFYEDLVTGVAVGDQWKVIVNGTPYSVAVVPGDEDGYVASFTFPAAAKFNIGDAYTFYVETTTGDYEGQYYVPVTITIPGTPVVKQMELTLYGSGWENWTSDTATYGIISQLLLCIKSVEDNATNEGTLYANKADYVWELVITDSEGNVTVTNCTPWSDYGGLNLLRFAIVENGEPAFIPQIYSYYDVTLNIKKNGTVRYTGTINDTYCGMIPVDKGEPCYDAPVVYPAELTISTWTNEFTSDWEVYNGQEVLLLVIASQYLNTSELREAGWTFAVDFNGDTHYYTPTEAQNSFYGMDPVDGMQRILVRIPTGTDFVPQSGETYEVTLAIYPEGDAEYNEAHPYYFGSISGIKCDTEVKYTVTWIVDGVETETYVDEGEIPTFPGTPVKAEDDDFTYEFIGWDSTPTWVYEDVTYTAQFKAVPKAQYQAGDINGDSVISIGDVSALLNYISSGSTAGLVESNLDVNNDGVVSIGDVSALLNMIAS